MNSDLPNWTVSFQYKGLVQQHRYTSWNAGHVSQCPGVFSSLSFVNLVFVCFWRQLKKYFKLLHDCLSNETLLLSNII